MIYYFLDCNNASYSFEYYVNDFVTFSVSQKGSVLVLAFNVLSWSFGTWALYAQRIELYGMVVAFNCTLGFVIFTFHTLGNNQVSSIN